MEKVKWGVLGTADIARGQTIPAMKLAENCELYAIAGRNLEKAKKFQQEFGFKKAYGSYDELLTDPEVEAVYIPLPNDLGCYSLSMALWMIGRDPEAVRASAHFSEKHIDLYTTALLLYENGAIAKLDCGMLLPHGRLDRLHIYGVRGEIHSPVQFNQCGEIPYTVIRDGVRETRKVNAPNNYALETEQLSRCVLETKTIEALERSVAWLSA